MKTYLLKPMVVVCLCLLTASFTFAADNYKMVKVKAPFPINQVADVLLFRQVYG